jgi:hypothetical protein
MLSLSMTLPCFSPVLMESRHTDPVVLAPKKKHSPVGSGTLPNFPPAKTQSPPPIPSGEPSLFKMTPNFIEAIPLANAMYSAPGFLNYVGMPVPKQQGGSRSPSPESSWCQTSLEALEALQAKIADTSALPARVAELEEGIATAFRKLGKAVARKHALRVEVDTVQADLLAAEDKLQAAERKIEAQRAQLAELNRIVSAQRAENAELVKLKSKRGVDALHAKVATLEADLEKLRAKRGTGALQVRIDALKDENAFLYGRIAAMGGDKWELEQVTGPGGATMLSELTVQVESARASEARLIQQLNVARTSVGQLVQQLELVRAENGRLAVLVHDFVQKERAATAEPSWRDIVEPRASAASLWRDSDSEVWSFPADGPHFVRP